MFPSRTVLDRYSSSSRRASHASCANRNSATPKSNVAKKKQKARAIDMFQAKELAREKGCKKERSADPAAERQYDAVIQQARTARERTKCHAASNRRAVLIWECSGRVDACVDGREP